MAQFNYLTKITWDHDMTTDTAFQNATTPILEGYVADQKTPTLTSIDSDQVGGNYVYARLWADSTTANAWITTVSAFTGYVGSEVTTLI